MKLCQTTRLEISIENINFKVLKYLPTAFRYENLPICLAQFNFFCPAGEIGVGV